MHSSTTRHFIMRHALAWARATVVARKHVGQGPPWWRETVRARATVVARNSSGKGHRGGKETRRHGAILRNIYCLGVRVGIVASRRCFASLSCGCLWIWCLLGRCLWATLRNIAEHYASPPWEPCELPVINLRSQTMRPVWDGIVCPSRTN